MEHGELLLLLGGKKGRLAVDEKEDGWSGLSAAGGGLSRGLVRVAMVGGRRWWRQWGGWEGGAEDEVEEGEPDLCGCPKRLWPLKLLGRIMVGMGHTYKAK